MMHFQLCRLFIHS